MSDRLDRALRALREGDAGGHPDAEATLQRVLAGRRAARRASQRRLRLYLPIAAVLAISTGALARWGRLETQTPPASSAGEVAAARVDPTPLPVAPLAVVAASASGAGEPEAPAAPPSVATGSPPGPDAVRRAFPAPSVAEARVERAPSAAAAMTSGVQDAGSAPVDPPSADVDVYAQAHRLHFDGHAPAASLAAWDDYLTRFPSGRFVLDARYNRAIDLLRLGRTAEARAALQPFADGALGGYHRDDARELLRSIAQ